MFSLKSDEHLFKLAKELYEDDNFYDIIFITESASFYGHSGLIFQYIPYLMDLICEGCKSGHEKVVIFLPEVRSEFLEISLLEFYLRGDPTKLKSVLNVDNVTNVKSEAKEIIISINRDVIEPEYLNVTNVDTDVEESTVPNYTKDHHMNIEMNDESDIFKNEFEYDNDYDVITPKMLIVNTLEVPQAENEEEIEDDIEHAREYKLAIEDKSFVHLKRHKIKDEEEKTSTFTNISDWLKHLDDNFIPTIANWLDAASRFLFMNAIEENTEMTSKLAMDVIHSLNYQVLKFIGRVKPDPTLSRCMAGLLRNKIPETFGLAQHKTDLAGRISYNFYNKYLRGSQEGEDKYNREELKEMTKQLPQQHSPSAPLHSKDFPKPIVEWLNHLDMNFFDIIFDNMERITREGAALSVQSRVRLSPKQNVSLINSLNFHIFKFIGDVRPDTSLCKQLAVLLKEKLPETYDDNLREEGMKRRKGEGGKTGLAGRISGHFYNNFVRSRKV